MGAKCTMHQWPLLSSKQKKRKKRKEKRKRKEKKKGKMNKEKKKRKPWVRGVVILQRDKKNTIRAGGSTAIAKCGLEWSGVDTP